MSRRPGQRRRGGGGRDQHADPSMQDDADALLNPGALEEQLSRRLAKTSSPVPAAAAAAADDDDDDDDVKITVVANHPQPTKSPAKKKATATANAPGAAATVVDTAALSAALASEAAQTAKHQQEAEAILRDGGDAAVQDALRAEIAKTKKLESDISQLKKKAEAAKRQQEAKSLEVAKLTQQKDTIHLACKKLIAERERLEAVLTDSAADDAKRREEVRVKFDKDVDGIIAKVDEQAAQKAEMVKENVELAKKFDELKAGFDAMMESKMGAWKDRDAETRTVVADLQQRMMMHDKLAQLAETRESEAESLKRGAEAYAEQAHIYESRMADFEGALHKSAEVVELTARREAEYHAEIGRFEEVKQSDIAARKAAEAELQKTKSRIREHRKSLLSIEKTKAQAEKRCRAAQEMLRKRQQQQQQQPQQ